VALAQRPRAAFQTFFFTHFYTTRGVMEKTHFEKVAECHGDIFYIDSFITISSFFHILSIRCISHSAVRSLQDSMVKPAPLPPEPFQLAEPERQELPNKNIGITK